MSEITLAVSRSKPLRLRRISAHRAHSLSNAARHLDQILKADNRCLRVSVGDWSTILGIPAASTNLPELTFQTYKDCKSALLSCRLHTLAVLFFRGRLTVSGAIDNIIDALYSINIRNDQPQFTKEKIAFYLFRKLKERAPSFARRFESNFHYSLDAEAYELFLDPYLQYTCGRFHSATTSLEEAQLEKFRLIKDWASERIGPIRGKKHLDVGCGWGGLISYFRQHYGTASIGITNCISQKRYISDRFGIRDILLGDFTIMRELKREFDLITVIGMSEHVVGGLKNTLLQNMRECLKDEGVLYFQTITKPDVWVGGDAYRVAQELIFPGHDLDTQRQAEERFAAAGFKIIHAEDHSLDYAHTTREWATRVKRKFARIEGILGPKDASLFLLYLLYASKLFENGRGKLMRYALIKH